MNLQNNLGPRFISNLGDLLALCAEVCISTGLGVPISLEHSEAWSVDMDLPSPGCGLQLQHLSLSPRSALLRCFNSNPHGEIDPVSETKASQAWWHAFIFSDPGKSKSGMWHAFIFSDPGKTLRQASLFCWVSSSQ